MDYLDPNKELKHRITLIIGYVLVAVAIIIATLILLYQAYGFGLGKGGTVIQNGLAFFSSQPSPANIYLNNTLNKAQTNSRVVLPAGIYDVRLTRDGYRDWRRTIEVEGGEVQRFDYPFLVPQKLTSKPLTSYASAPGLTTQSPDRRWLLVQQPGSMTNFQVYDLKSPAKPPLEFALPATVVTRGAGQESWTLGEWADDNKHVVLQHNFDGKSEFILVERTDAAQTVNLNTTLASNPVKLTLLDKKYDQYYLYQAGGQLQKANLSAPAPEPVLDHVLTYRSYGDDGLLYATDKDAPAGKVLIRLRIGDQTYPVRTFPASSNYLLDLAEYDSDLYVATGSSNENKAYIYKDPAGQLRKLPNHALVPSQVLRVEKPNYLRFSNSAQFIALENGTQFGVYDIENTRGYNYTNNLPPDPPQTHASWMDGNRLTYVSGGKLVIFDYDDRNHQALVSANPAYLPAFAPDYKFLYVFAPVPGSGQTALSQTSLLTPADQ